MKKTLVYGAATAAVLASLGAGFGLASCSIEAVYGPPPSEQPSSNSEADDPIEDVYGPPVDETDSDSSASSGSASEEGSDDEAITALYGPPPDSEKPDAEN